MGAYEPLYYIFLFFKKPLVTCLYLLIRLWSILGELVIFMVCLLLHEVTKLVKIIIEFVDVSWRRVFNWKKNIFFTQYCEKESVTFIRFVVHLQFWTEIISVIWIQCIMTTYFVCWVFLHILNKVICLQNVDLTFF